MTGAILCGGQSRRMGQPKAGIRLKSGLVMIEHVFGQLSQVCDKIVVVGHLDGVPSHLPFHKQIKDNYDRIGPLGGLEALLASGISEEYLVVPCDLFQLNKSVLELLSQFRGKPPVVLSYQGQYEPLLGRYPATFYPEVKRALDNGEYALHALLSRAQVATLELPQELAPAIRNANSPEDLNSEERF